MSTISEMTEFEKSLVGKGPSDIRNWYYGSYMSDTPWCACTQSYAASHCGLIGKCFVKTDGAGCFAREGVPKGYGKWYLKSQTTPKEGDLILYRYGGTYTDQYHSDHVGYVYKVANGYVYSIEGNTNGSNDTSTVNYCQHSLTDYRIHGYYRPNYPDSDTNNNESEEEKMNNFCKGDKGDAVLAYKSLIVQADALGIVAASVDSSNSFGSGTYNATVEVQKKFGLEVDGIAGVKTITALRNAINEELKNVQKPIQISNGWGIGIRFLKICLRALQAKGIIKTKPDTKFGYGSNTNKAIREIQKVAGIDVDGIAGEKTANAIEKYLMEE